MHSLSAIDLYKKYQKYQPNICYNSRECNLGRNEGRKEPHIAPEIQRQAELECGTESNNVPDESMNSFPLYYLHRSHDSHSNTLVYRVQSLSRL